MQREFNAQMADLMGKLKEDRDGLVKEMRQRDDKDISRYVTVLEILLHSPVQNLTSPIDSRVYSKM